jgi:isocitrate/isopropylmalate dehydrogenase
MRNLGLDIAHHNRANPTALLLAAARMLRHIQMPTEGARLDAAVRAVIAEGKVGALSLAAVSRSH